MPHSKSEEDALISIRNVDKTFGTGDQPTLAVTNINLAIKRGEFVTLLGPSGCGKSTLLNMTSGLMPASSGTIVYDGQVLRGINHATGYMTQADHLLPWRTAYSNIAVPLEIAGVSRVEMRERTDQLIELVGLTGFQNSYPHELSGGMRKRVALARLLAYDPETLLLDEPFSALDAQLRFHMQLQLRRLCRDLGKTVMFVTHDIDEAALIGDQCVVFSKHPGTIRAILPSPFEHDRDLFELRRRPQYQQFTAELWDLIMPQDLAAGEATP